MKKHVNFILLYFLFAVTIFMYADSPLTSTPFSQAYMDIAEVKYAGEHSLDTKLLEFLASDKSNSVYKIAVINAFSWGKKDLVTLFENYLLKNRTGLKKDAFSYLRTVSDDQPAENDQTKLLSADDMMCWGYLQVMGDYDHPAMGMRAGYLSYARDPNSMSEAVVFTLIAAQKAFDNNWCNVYKIPQTMLAETQYSVNVVKPESIKIILDYTGLYASECK